MSEHEPCKGAPGPVSALFGNIPIKVSSGVPEGHVLVLAHPDERQQAGLDFYPRDDQLVLVKLFDSKP